MKMFLTFLFITVLCTALIFVVGYLCGSLSNWTFNLNYWTDTSRDNIVVGCLVMFIFGLAISIIGGIKYLKK